MLVSSFSISMNLIWNLFQGFSECQKINFLIFPELSQLSLSSLRANLTERKENNIKVDPIDLKVTFKSLRFYKSHEDNGN